MVCRLRGRSWKWDELLEVLTRLLQLFAPVDWSIVVLLILLQGMRDVLGLNKDNVHSSSDAFAIVAKVTSVHWTRLCFRMDR